MEKYIGIICRNSKTATLLGKILEGTLGLPNEKFRFILDCIDILNGIKKDSRGAYLASFSHPLKVIVSMITGVPFELFDDQDKKKEYIININTFQYKEGSPTITQSALYDKCLKKEPIDGWMTLNDFVNYFGHTICKRFINQDIWVRCEEVSCNSLTSGNGYRIYSDVRTMSEYEFIKSHTGVIITIDTRSATTKEGCIFDKTLLYKETDYRINVDDKQFGSMDTLSEIYNIVQDIQLNKII